VSSALAESGLQSDSIPEDVLEALRAGRIGSAELSNWKNVLGNPLLRVLALSSYFRDRLLAEPRLATVLGIEIALGGISNLAAEKASRGERFAKEIDFVVANLALIITTNIALVLALCPVAPIGLPPAAGTFAAWSAKMPGYFLQKGDFTAAQRATCFFSKAVQFAFVGTFTSAIGQASTIGLVKARSKMDPENAPDVVLAPIVPTSTAFAIFMGASSNTRYQVVNSFEGNLLPVIPGGKPVQTLLSFAVRMYNNYLGSCNWIWWARVRGLQ